MRRSTSCAPSCPFSAAVSSCVSRRASPDTPACSMTDRALPWFSGKSSGSFTVRVDPWGRSHRSQFARRADAPAVPGAVGKVIAGTPTLKGDQRVRFARSSGTK